MNLTKSIRVILTDRERIERGQRLAQVLDAIDSCKEAAKSDAQRHKARTQEFLEEAKKLNHAVAHGEEFRDIAVKEERDERLGVVRVKRIDTGEIVDERPMSASERQVPLKTKDGKSVADADEKKRQEVDAPQPVKHLPAASKPTETPTQPKPKEKPKSTKASTQKTPTERKPKPTKQTGGAS